MRHVVLALVLVGFALPGMAQDAKGLWRTEATSEGSLEVRISACGSNLCGVIERARDPNGKEGPFLHLGKRMIWGMAPDGPGTWRGGKIWDPRNDRTFNSKMARSGADLTVSGCVLGLCQKQTWTPVR